MNAVTCETGGRAPPEQHTRSPVGLNQWRLHWLTLLQDLIGLAKLMVFAFQCFDPCLLSRRLAWPFAAITPGLADPNAKAVRRTAQFTCDRRQRRSFAPIIIAVFHRQPHRTRAELR